MKPVKSTELETAIEAARKASEILLTYYTDGDAGEVIHKGAVDRASQADLESEKLIREILASKFPDYNVTGEELGETKTKSDYTWYIDPLCGSNDFIRGFPDFGLSIALVQNEEIQLGVCSLPAFKEMFWAQKNKGAYLNGERISVSKVSDINDSIVTTHISAKVEDLKKSVSIIEKIAGLYIKIPGSFPYSVCNLARGRSDAHVEVDVAGIHSLASRIITQEAGGKASRLDGSDLKIFDEEVVITNGLIHEQLISRLNI